MCLKCVFLCFLGFHVFFQELPVSAAASSSHNSICAHFLDLLQHISMAAVPDQTAALVTVPAGTAMEESLRPASAFPQHEAEETVSAAPAATQEASAAQAEMQQNEKEADPLVKCRRCNAEVKASEAVCMPKFRDDLKHTCKPCWALNTQMSRHGIDINKALSEQDAVAFFVEAREQRLNGSENRLAYSDARALLKQKMVVAAKRVDSHGEDGEWQPLSYWELQGYDSTRISQLAEEKDHPILGKTYRIDISKQSTHHVNTVTEERILTMESAAMERRRAATAAAASSQTAPAAPPLELPVLLERDTQAGKKRKSPEEKAAAQEQAKAQRAENKKRSKLETVARSAAAKLLPQLKQVHEKLQAAANKTKAVCSVPLSAEDDRTISEAAEALEKGISNATSMLADAAKGKSLAALAESDLLNDKDLQKIVKDGNNAVRVAQLFVRQNKENALVKANQGRKQK